MMEILDCLHDALGSGRPAYVHCRAGIGRTGMVVGCLLVERGLTGEQALEELARLWQQSERSKFWPSVPETDAQTDYVRRWKPRKLNFTLAAPVAPPRRAPAQRPEPAPAAPDPLLEPATLAAARSLRERFLGALLGLAVGDAVAAATQYRQPGTFTPIGDLIGGGPFELPRGGWSDDTAMALCLADSLLASRRLRCPRPGGALQALAARRLPVGHRPMPRHHGQHRPCARRGELAAPGLRRFACPRRSSIRSPSRGSLPVVMFSLAAEQEAVQLASEAARTTCQAPAVLDACRDLARALFLALSGQPKAHILAAVSAPFRPRGTQGGSATRNRQRERIRGNDTVTDALSIALEAFATTGNFRDAVLHAANHGGNSDVAAAACGQLAGAHYGAAAIPAPWRDCLLQRSMIETYADRLLQHALLKMG